MVDPSLTQRCQPMPPIPTQSDGQIQMGELVLADIELAGMYRECARRHQGLAEAVEKLQ